jgi:hypothetical protein
MAGTKKQVTVVGDLESHLMDLIAPVLAALPRPISDVGHDAPTDGSIGFIYSSVINLLMEQTYGELSFRDKRTGAITAMPNAKQRRDNSEEQFRKLQQKHSGNDDALVSDPDYERIVGWKHVNDARFTCYMRHIDAFTAVYTAVTGKPYEWVPRTPRAIEAKVISASEKKRRLEELKALAA